jgi:hypothetical protein
LTLLLNILLAGRTCVQPRRPRHLWATVPGDSSFSVKWVQDFFFAKFGEAVIETASPLGTDRLKELTPDTYYTSVVHDGRNLEVPTDLDELICWYTQLTAQHRATFDRGCFWVDMAARQWTISFSASFASLVMAIEALGEHNKKPTARFHDYLEQFAPGASLQDRRRKMYALRSDILHGSGLMGMDQDADFGWSPPEQGDKDLMEELWGLTKLSMRNWLQNPPT